MKDREKMNQQEEQFIRDYFDEKFNHLKELLIEKITENQKDILDHSTSIKDLQEKTAIHTIEIEKIKESLKKEEKEDEKNMDRKIKLKYLWLGVPIAIITQIAIQYIFKLLFP